MDEPDGYGDSEVRLRGGSAPAHARRVVVTIEDDAPGRAEQLELARPRLLWRGGTVPIPPSGVIIGRSGNGEISLLEEETVERIVEIVQRGTDTWLRPLLSTGDCSVSGELLGTSTRRLATGEEIVVSGEVFRFVATVDVDIGAASRRTRRSVRPTKVERIELRLTISDELSASGDVVIEAGADAQLLHVLRAAADTLHVSWSGGAARCERMQGELDLLQTVGDAGLLWGDRIMLGTRCVGVATAPRGAREGRGGRIPVNRAPRIRRPAPSVEIELRAPPDEAGKARFPYIASLLPLLAGITMAVVLRNPVFLVFTALAPMMAVSTYISERRTGRDRYAERAAKFRSDVAAADATLSAAYVTEGEYRFEAAPGLDALLPRAVGSRPQLWERRPTDDDFLVLRAGIGSVPFTPQVNFQRGGSEALRTEAQRHLDRFDRVDGVPVVIDVAELGVLGITGQREAANGVARCLVMQATLLHSPADLLVAAAISHRQSTAWWWLKWLPHVSEASVLLQCPPLASGDIAASALLERVRLLQDARLAARSGRLGGDRRDPHLLLLIDGRLEFDRSVATSVLDACKETDVSVMWIADEQSALPLQSGAVMTLTPPQMLDLAVAASGERITGVRSEPLGVTAAESAARSLAPLVDRGARRQASGVPIRVSLLELLGLEEPDPEVIAAHWKAPQDDLAAPVGAGSGGAFEIDLRRDGPHALVVGTTGSGKSELLRSIVCALAANHPPSRVSFLLFDYKGGAAFGPCAGFPHVFDVVSDLDEHLGQRALVALDAELLRRERVLAEVGAKDILDLARKAPQRTPPALVLAVDEFAKLRDEVPDFVDGVVDVAQRGRSLGVHMILASQTLGNAFTTPIRANTNLRIALRAADESQSEEAIGSREAAHVPSGPDYSGRGFARAGHGRLTEFQTAYVSGTSSQASSNEIHVRRYELDGVRTDDAVGRPLPTHPQLDEETDLQRLVSATCAACEDLGILPPPAPWLPPLPAVIRVEDLPALQPDGSAIAIGLVDEPRAQRQPPLIFNPSETGFMVAFGAGGSGRTTLLRTVAGAVASGRSPEAAQLYVIDARGRGLAALSELPHCGAVISATEEERIDRLLGRLVELIEARAKTFAEVGVSTLSEYRQRVPAQSCPQVTLLLDDLDEFVRTYDSAAGADQLQRLGRIVSAGRQVGVAVIATAASRGGLGASLMTHVARRIVLRMPSADDAIGLGVDSAIARTVNPEPGRAFVDGGLEAQIAHIGESPSGVDQINAVREIAARAAAHWPAAAAPAVRTLPDVVRLDGLPSSRDLASVIVGIGGNDLLPTAIDLSEGHVLVSGPRRSGRSTALLAFAQAVSDLDRAVDLRILAPRRSPLHGIGGGTSVATDPASCASLLTEVAALVNGRSRGTQDQPVITIIDDAADLTDASFGQVAERIARYGPEVGVHLVVAVDKTTARGFTHPWVRILANDGRGLVLQPEDASAADHLGGELPRRSPVPRQPGRGYLVRDGSVTLVQIGTTTVAPTDARH